MSRPAHRPRLLVVDDHEDLHQLVSWIFRDLDWEIDFARDGCAALQRVEEAPPDLMLLDLLMPDFDGWRVLECLRTLPGAPSAVVLTVAGEADSFERAARLGAAAYIFKPFRVDDLVSTCERILGVCRAAGGGEERRREPRRLLAVDLVARLQSEPLRWAKLVDLSPNGAMLDLASPARAGDRVRFHLQTLDGQVPLEAEGLVCWTGLAPRGFAHGIAFEPGQQDQAVQIRGLLGLGA